jgi:hypothetical protein
MLRSMLVTCAALAGMATSAVAQDFSDKPIKYFTPENVTAIVTKLGGQNVNAAKTDNGTVVRFDANGATYTSLITACKGQPGCLGLLLGIPVSLEGGTFSQDAVNSFNAAIPFGKAARTNDGKTVILYRYVIADGGILEANLGTNIAVFSVLPTVFAKHLSQQVVASVDQAQPKVVQMSAVTAPSAAPPTIGLKAPTASAHDDFEQHLKLFAGERSYKLPY